MADFTGPMARRGKRRHLRRLLLAGMAFVSLSFLGDLGAAPVSRAANPDPEVVVRTPDTDLIPLDRLPEDELMAALVAARSAPAAATAGLEPTFAQLLRQPADHQGQLVALQGIVRRALRHPLPPNAHGIDHFLELWIFTEDSRVNPYVVIAGGVPAEMPLGAGLREQIELTGTFQFLVSYRASDTLRKAPLIVANQVSWRPSAGTLQTRTRPLRPLAWLAAALGSLVLWRSLVAWSRRQQAARASGGRHVAVDPRVLQSLQPLGGATVPERSPLGEWDDLGKNETSDDDRRRAREVFGANGGPGPGPSLET